ncbi:MAG: type III-B CRISPR module RAMP protein Cmr1 [Thermoproteota archaeon]
MSSWLELQKDLVETHELIAEIEVETITFTRIGGYKATPYSLGLNLLSDPAARSLKGIWRWWARAAIVGAYNGKVDYKKANEHLNMILGGTGKGEGTSLFRLEISDFEFPPNYKDELNQINYEIDKFFEKVKDFFKNQIPKLGLPQNTKVSVSLNPSDPAIIIEHKIKLSRYKNNIDSLVKKGPLGCYFVESKLTKGNNRIIIRLRIHKLNYYPEIPRVRLLLMKREEEEDILNGHNIDSEKIVKYLERVKEEMVVLVSKGIKFKISLYGSKDPEKINFALSSLMLSLIFGGIGSITKRAFGSLKLLSYRFGGGIEVDQKIREIFQKLKDGEFTSNELKETLEKLCEITINHAKKSFNINGGREQSIPVVPSLSNIKIEVVECESLDLAKIGNAFVKQTWKSLTKAQGRALHTWILGLPRFQKETGYAIKRKHDDKTYYDPLRRTSSIGARCFKARNKNFIIIFGLLSNDWPKELYHIRRKWQPDHEKLIEGTSIGKVFDCAFKKVLSGVCGK